MTEMPFDIINNHLGALAADGTLQCEPTDAAIAIDQVLQEKFLFFPLDELRERASQDTRNNLIDSARDQWDRNDQKAVFIAAEMLLAAWIKTKDEEALRATKRPKPGVYIHFAPWAPAVMIHVTEARRVLALSGRSLHDITRNWDEGKFGADDLVPLSRVTVVAESDEA